MVFCSNCGASVEGRFCAKCGTPVAAAPAGTPTSGASATPPPPPYNPPGAQPYGGQQYTPPGAQPYSQGPATAGGISENVAGALCYVLGLITGILFLVLAPYNQSKFVRFHAFQSIFLHGAWIVFWIVVTMISMMLPWSLSILSSLLWLAISLGGLVLWIICMVKAFNHDRFKVPVIGDMAEKQA